MMLTTMDTDRRLFARYRSIMAQVNPDLRLLRKPSQREPLRSSDRNGRSWGHFRVRSLAPFGRESRKGCY